MGARLAQRPAWPEAHGLEGRAKPRAARERGSGRPQRPRLVDGEETAVNYPELGKRSGRVHKKELLVSDAKDEEEVGAEARALRRRDLWEQPVRKTRVTGEEK